MTSTEDWGWTTEDDTFHPKLDDELNKTAWADTLKRLAASPAALDGARYARFAQFMKDRGLITEAQPVSRYAVAR